MSVLGGVFQLDGTTAAPVAVDALAARHRHSDFTGQFIEGPIQFHWAQSWTTPEAIGESFPIESPDRRLVLTYCGRIDNRSELIARYAAPPSGGDGLLLLAALSRDGAAGLRHCVGDFVLAAWDRVDRRLWLARDALGHRPLYYVLDGQQLTWSTDFSSLRAGPARGSRPNAGYLAEYLSGAIVSRDETVFDEIRRVPPATALMFTPAQPRAVITEYWTPPADLPARRSDQALIEEFRAHLETAVMACVRTAGTVATELSGGLDSSSVTALVAEATRRAPATYSMVFPGTPLTAEGERLDESMFIDAMAAAVGASSWRHDPRAATRADLERVLTAHRDLPDWPNGDVIRWPMARAAAGDGHRVLLTGIGGDQWLTGSVARLPGLLRRGRFIEAWKFLQDVFAPAGLDPSVSSVARRVGAAATPQWLKRTVRTLSPARPWPLWLQPAFVADTRLSQRLRALPARVPTHADAVLRDSLTRLASAEGLLTRESVFRTTDDAGIEARHPFFDRRVVEFVLTLPDDLRFRHGQTRYILRQAMGTRLPPMIASRLDKGNGDVLITHALSRTLAGFSTASLHVADAGWINGDWLRAACRAFVESDGPRRRFEASDNGLWGALSVELWLRDVDAGRA